MKETFYQLTGHDIHYFDNEDNEITKEEYEARTPTNTNKSNELNR